MMMVVMMKSSSLFVTISIFFLVMIGFVHSQQPADGTYLQLFTCSMYFNDVIITHPLITQKREKREELELIFILFNLNLN